MKSLHKITFGILLWQFLLSCQKNIEEGTDPPDPPTSLIDSNYLDKVIYTFYNSGSVEDHGVAIFGYDSQKRVIVMGDSGHISGFYAKTLYTYNSNDTLPSTSLFVRYDTPANDSVKKFFFYDASGRKLKDSILNYEYDGTIAGYTVSQQICYYSYAAGKMFQQEYFSYHNNGTWDLVRRDTATLNSNGDIVSNKKYVLDGSAYNLFETSTFTHDTQRSPFGKLSLAKTLPFFPAGDDYYHGIFQTYNNVTSINNSYVGPPASNTTLNFNFIYNQRGFPDRSVGFWAPSDSLKFVYVYKAL